MKTPVFRTGRRVDLRPPLKKDIPLLVRWINDPEVSRYLTVNFPMLEKDEEKWLERLSEKNRQMLFSFSPPKTVKQSA